MRRIAPLLIALIAAGIAFFMNTEGPIEACGNAVITFLIFFTGAYLLLHKRTPKGE